MNEREFAFLGGILRGIANVDRPAAPSVDARGLAAGELVGGLIRICVQRVTTALPPSAPTPSWPFDTRPRVIAPSHPAPSVQTLTNRAAPSSPTPTNRAAPSSSETEVLIDGVWVRVRKGPGP